MEPVLPISSRRQLARTIKTSLRNFNKQLAGHSPAHRAMNRTAAETVARFIRCHRPFLLSINPPIRSLSSSSPEHDLEPPRDAAQLLRRWGCTDADISQILHRHPSILRMKLPSLHSKLQVLRGIGILSADLVRIVQHRPRLLAARIGPGLSPRLAFLRTLFPSHSALLRAIVRNPSLLYYDIDQTLRPCVLLYQSLGVSPNDLGRLLLSRPTVVAWSSIDGEKLELIRRTQLQTDAAMYKYAVAIIAVSRIDTIRSKIANLEKFGFSPREVMALFAKTPNVLTLSLDKVQRNMTYITGTMKLPACAVLEKPLLLYCNLEKVLKPRHLVRMKLQEMGLEPLVMSTMSTMMQMREPRFLKVFVKCHEKDVTDSLMEFYTTLKKSRRLAESSKSGKRKGFPF